MVNLELPNSNINLSTSVFEEDDEHQHLTRENHRPNEPRTFKQTLMDTLISLLLIKISFIFYNISLDMTCPDPSSIGNCVAWFVENHLELGFKVATAVILQLFTIYKYPLQYPMYVYLIYFFYYASIQETVDDVIKHGQLNFSIYKLMMFPCMFFLIIMKKFKIPLYHFVTGMMHIFAVLGIFTNMHYSDNCKNQRLGLNGSVDENKFCKLPQPNLCIIDILYNKFDKNLGIRC
jgi:hypothetical protein